MAIRATRRNGAYYADEQPDVRLSKLVTDEVVLASENLLNPVKRVEQRNHGFFVRLLSSGKASFVHAI